MIIRADAGLAQTLALASVSGTLWFLLRPAGNATPTPKRTITSTDLQERINRQPNAKHPSGSRAVDHTIRAVVAVEGLDAFDVQRSLPDDASFQLLGMTEGVDETVRALQAQDADIIVVACQGREDDRSLQIIDGAHRAAPDVPIIVLSAASPNGFLRRAFEVGAADMAIFPQSKEQLRFAMSKAIARRPGLGSADGERREGRLVCVLGPKGGTGKTLTSSNLAVALALAGQKVLVIDLDLQFGDVALCMGLPPEKTMYDLAVSGGSLDADKLADYVMTHHDRRRRAPRPRAARPGERDHDRAAARRPRRSRASTTTTWSPTPRRGSPRR